MSPARTRASFLVLALALPSLACSTDPPPRASTRHATHEAPPETEAPPVEETLPAPRDVTFTTTDGVTIAATLHRAARVDAPAIVLVHQLSSTRAEWAPLLERLHASPAFTTLAIDLRGHGASTHGPSGNLDWQSFDDAAWAATRLDVLAAVAWLAGPDSGVAPSSISAVGSSIGCSAVVAAAAEEPRLRVMVTLSPGRAYHGFDAITPVMQLDDRAIFAIASRDETDSVDTAAAYGRVTHVESLVVDGDAHGVVIFGTTPTTLDRVEEFLRERLAWTRLAPPPSDEAAPPPVTSLGTPAPAPPS